MEELYSLRNWFNKKKKKKNVRILVVKEAYD